MGTTDSLAISRVMGLILAKVAVQFIINGIHDVVVEWAGELDAMF